MGIVATCPYLQNSEQDIYIYKLPIFLLLLANTFFLIWIMAFGPSSSGDLLLYRVYEGTRASLLSLQGVLISLPYCFFNSEVQNVIKIHWKRWEMVKEVGKTSSNHTVTTLAGNATSFHA